MAEPTQLAPGVFYLPPIDRPPSPTTAFLASYMALRTKAAEQGFLDHLKPMSPAERAQQLIELERVGQLREQARITAYANAEREQSSRIQTRQTLTTTAADLERQRADAASREAQVAAEQGAATQRALIGLAQEQLNQRGQTERTNAETARALLVQRATSAAAGTLDPAQQELMAKFQAEALRQARDRGAQVATRVEIPKWAANNIAGSDVWMNASPEARNEMARRMFSVVSDLETGDAASATAAGSVLASVLRVAPPVPAPAALPPAALPGGAGAGGSVSTSTRTSEPAPPSQADLDALRAVRGATSTRVRVGSDQAPIRGMISDVQSERNAIDTSLRPVQFTDDPRAREAAIRLLQREGPGGAAPIEQQAADILRRIRGGAR